MHTNERTHTPFNSYNTLNRCLVLMFMRVLSFDMYALRVIAFVSIYSIDRGVHI